MNEQEFHRRQRRARVVNDWLAGASMDTIAARHAMTREAVRHIIDTTPDARRERDLRTAEDEKARVKSLHRRLARWSNTHPGQPVTVAAQRYGLSVQDTIDLLGERARLHPRRRSSPRERFSQDEILDRIREHVETTGDHRAETYQRSAREMGWASLPTVVSRLGTWRAALAAAGVPAPTLRTPRRPAIPDAELCDWVTRYLAQAITPSWRDMDAWLHTHDGPSVSTIRHRIGTWPDLFTMAGTAP